MGLTLKMSNKLSLKGQVQEQIWEILILNSSRKTFRQQEENAKHPHKENMITSQEDNLRRAVMI